MILLVANKEQASSNTTHGRRICSPIDFFILNHSHDIYRASLLVVNPYQDQFFFENSYFFMISMRTISGMGILKSEKSSKLNKFSDLIILPL